RLPPRTRSPAARRRWPAWRRWGWRPGRRTRCRDSCVARRPVRRRPPSTAPSTARRTPGPPPPALRWPRPRPAVPAWPPTELASPSAGRRAGTPRGYRHGNSYDLLGAQLCELLDGLAQQLDVDVLVVLSRMRRAGVADPAGGFGEHRDDPGSQNRPLDALVV